MRKFLAVLTLMVAGQAWATPPSPITAWGETQKIEVAGLGPIDYVPLFEETSLEGESLDAFILRIAPRLADYTAATGFEACGSIATDGERFGVVVGSNGGHTVCLNFHNRLPMGMVFTSQTVHSHTTMKAYRLTPVDVLVVAAGRPVGAVQRGGNPARFSEEDYAQPGYMISGQVVKHQAGKGTDRVIGSLP